MSTDTYTKKPMTEWGTWKDTKDWCSETLSQCANFHTENPELSNALAQNCIKAITHLSAGYHAFGTDTKVASFDKAQSAVHQTVGVLHVCHELSLVSTDDLHDLSTKAAELATAIGRSTGALVKKAKEKLQS